MVLFFIPLNKKLYRFDGDSDSLIRIVRFRVGRIDTRLYSLLIPNGVEHRARTRPKNRADREYRGRFHLTCQNSKTLPCLPTVRKQRLGGHTGRIVLSVEGILTLYHSHVMRKLQSLCGIRKCGQHLKIGHGGKLNRSILSAGPVKSDRTRGDEV